MTPRALALLLLAAGLASAQGSPAAVVHARDDGSGEGPAYLFDPDALRAPPGGTVRVQNDGMDVHTFTHDAPAEARLFHTGPVEPGASADVAAPEAPGEYGFYCVFHGGMRGTLLVETTPATPAAPDATTTSPPTGTTTTSPPANDAPLAAWLALAALAGVALLRRRA